MTELMLRADVSASVESPLQSATAAILRRFGEGATLPEDLPELQRLVEELDARLPLAALDQRLRSLSHAGYLRGAVVVIADHLARNPRLDLALRLASELLDALEPELGVELARAILSEPPGPASEPTGAVATRARVERAELEISTNLMLGEHLLERGDLGGALRHFEAVLAIDVDHSRALRGWSTCVRELERRGQTPEHRSRVHGSQRELQLGGHAAEIRRPDQSTAHGQAQVAAAAQLERDEAMTRLHVE